MTYINIKNGNGPVETVDEFETRKEALEMLAEYRMGDRVNNYYASSRCTKYWKER